MACWTLHEDFKATDWKVLSTAALLRMDFLARVRFILASMRVAGAAGPLLGCIAAVVRSGPSNAFKVQNSPP